MLQGKDISSLFGSTISVTKLEETLDRYTAEAIYSGPVLSVKLSLPQLLQTSAFADRLVVMATLGEVIVAFDSGIDDNEKFFTAWEKYQQEADATDKAELSIVIEKKLQDQNAFFVYDSGSFFNYLQRLSPIDLIGIFSGQFKQVGSTLVFVNPSFAGGDHTQTIFFLPDLAAKASIVAGIFNREKIWEKVNGICHLSGVGDCLVLPEDFSITDASCIPAPVQTAFQKTCLLLALGILFDYTTVQGDSVTLKLNGYKTFQANLSLTTLKLANLPIYYEIYCWVVAGGNLQDKVGLSRNLISLNIDPADNYTVIPSVYNSILSGFKVYEKQNIKQYIELRNKISDQLIGFNEKAGKIVDSFAGSFQKSALAVVSLYASFIVTRVLTTHAFENVFSKDATILSFAFLLASLLYYFVSRWEIRQQKKRFEDSYDDMKRRNEDLLTPDDIQKILNGDTEHTKDVGFINDKQVWYSWMWIGFLIIFAIATSILALTYQPPALSAVLPVSGHDTSVVNPLKTDFAKSQPMVDTSAKVDTVIKKGHVPVGKHPQ